MPGSGTSRRLFTHTAVSSSASSPRSRSQRGGKRLLQVVSRASSRTAGFGCHDLLRDFQNPASTHTPPLTPATHRGGTLRKSKASKRTSRFRKGWPLAQRRGHKEDVFPAEPPGAAGAQDRVRATRSDWRARQALPPQAPGLVEAESSSPGLS